MDRESWPAVGARPTPLLGALPPADCEWFRTWDSHMLREPRQAAAKQSELGLKRAHNDPDLFWIPGAYFIFLHHPEQSSMLRWVRARGRKGALRVFFVKKEVPRLRVIFDTRMLNTHFVGPPKIALPSAAAMASIEAPAGSDFYWGSADFPNALYCMWVPLTFPACFPSSPFVPRTPTRLFWMGHL